jgi:hypothetical protein
MFYNLALSLSIMFNMKVLLLSALLASATFGTVIPRAGQKVDYNGFKALRITLPEGSADIQAQVKSLVAHILNPGKKEFDVVVAPQDVAALNALVGESKVLNDDVGAALKEEGEMKAYAGKFPSSAQE